MARKSNPLRMTLSFDDECTMRLLRALVTRMSASA